MRMGHKMVRIRRVAAIAVLCVVAAAYGTVSPAHADTTVTNEVLFTARPDEAPEAGDDPTGASARAATQAGGDLL